MAKGNMLLGQARGKVGSLVFSRLNGQQITRAKAENVSNPRTDSQNLQRAIFATVAKSAQAFGAIVDHSFQSVNYGGDSLNYFRKRNLDMLRAAYFRGDSVDLLTKGADSVVANEYLIAQGSLPTVKIGRTPSELSVNGLYPFEVVGLSYTASGENAFSVTLNNLSQAFSIKAGDQLTVVAVVNKRDYEDTPEGFGRVVYARTVILDGIAGSTNVVLASGFNPDAIDPNATTNSSWLLVRAVNETPHLSIAPTLGGLISSDEEIQAVAIIVSRYDAVSQKWLRSSARLVTSAKRAVANADGDQSAIDSYGNAVNAAESNEYLNQADSTTVAPVVEDNGRGNIIVRAYSPDGSLLKEVKQDTRDGDISLDMGVPETSVEFFTVKLTTFKGVKIQSVEIFDDEGSQFPISVTASGSQASSGNIARIATSLPLQVHATTTFEGGSPKAVVTFVDAVWSRQD